MPVEEKNRTAKKSQKLHLIPAEVPSSGFVETTESQDLVMEGAIKWRSQIASTFDALQLSESVWTRYVTCCSKSVLLERIESGEHKLAFETCGSRFCPHCAKRYRLKIGRQIEDLLGRVKPHTWRFVTLTLPHSDEKLANQLEHLQQSFRRLRQTTIWQQTQLLGVAVFELTFNEESQQWHPHLHVLSRGLFLSQKKLSEAWARCSRGAKIVDIRRVRSAGGAAHYVSKYLGKQPELEGASDYARAVYDYVVALRHRKMVLNFGVRPLPDIDERPTDLPKERDGWRVVCSYETLIAKARSGDVEAREILTKVTSPYRDDPHLTPSEIPIPRE